MDALLEQLNLDKSFFIELGLIAVIFIALSNVYFRPFLKLIEARRKKTVEDREAAQSLMAQAQAKWDDYSQLLAKERLEAKKQLDLAVQEAKKQETKILSEAREEAKKITQETLDSIHRQRDQLKQEISSDIESIAQSISEKILSRKA